MKPRAKAITVAALAGAFLVAGLLPFTLMALPNPPEYREVAAMDERGAYARDGDRLLRLYPHPEETDAFPDETAEVAPDFEIVIKSRQYDELVRYELRSFASKALQETHRFIDDDRILHVVPTGELSPGEYTFESVEDSMYGEPEYYYFAVAGD